MASHTTARMPAESDAPLPRASSSLTDYLHLHVAVQQRMERRLAAIDAEMRELEVLRVQLAALHQDTSRRGGSVHAIKKHNSTSKRQRVEAPPTVFYPLSHRVCGVPAKLLQSPLFEAGAYIRGNANLRHAPLPLSQDEQRQREIDYLFPARPRCMKGCGDLPPTAVQRLSETLTDAGLSADDFAVSPASPQQRIMGRVRPTAPELKALCDAVPRDELRAVFLGEAGEAATLSAALYALVGEAAALRTVLAPALRVRNVELFQLPRHTQQPQLNVIDWTLRHCCACEDRDLMANTHVEYLKTLQAISTAPVAGALRETLAYAAAYAQLARPLTEGRLRGSSPRTLITVCGGIFAEFGANVSTLWTRLEVLPVRDAVMAALAGDDTS